MEDTQNNPPEEHETHTTALVFLVLTTLIISFVVLTWSGDIDDPYIDYQDDDTTTPADDLPDNRTNGSIVPVNRVAATAATSLSGIPSGLYVNPDDVQNNFTSNFESGQIQRVIIFDDNLSLSELSSQYQTWLEDSRFTLDTNQANDNSHTLVGTDGDDSLTIAITDMGDGSSRVQLNYVTR